MATPEVIAPETRESNAQSAIPARVSLGGMLALLPWSLIAPIGVLLLTVAAFLPAIMSEYVYWDDDDLLLTNTIYRSLTSESLRWMFTTSYAGHFEPLTWLSYWLDWTLWKREVSGYHFTNVVLHAGTALAFYFLVRQLLRLVTPGDPRDGYSRQGEGSRRGAESSIVVNLASAFAALLFAIHPLRVESVAWLAERRDVLSGFFFVAAVLSYVRWRTHQPGQPSTRGWYWLAVLCQLLSLLAKASAISLPLVLLILDLYPLRRLSAVPWIGRTAKLIWDKIPFLILSVAAGARAWVAQVETGAMYPLSEYDLPSRIAQATYGFAFYAWKSLLPVHLGPLYSIPRREVLLGWILWKGLLGSAILLGLAVIFRKRRPAVAAAVAAYIAMVLPTSGLFQSGPQLVADRYSYLSCLGFAVLPAAGLYSLSRNKIWRIPNVPSLFGLICTGLVTVLFFATTNQTLIWSSALELWKHAVTVSPDSSIVHTNLADAFMSLPEPNTHEAIAHYRQALEINPKDAIAAHHFGDALLQIGNPAAAEKLYLYALGLDPGRARAVISLAQIWLQRGQPYNAADILRDRVQRAPLDLSATAMLAELLATYPDPGVRNGCEAVELARRVSAAYQHANPHALLTWGTALAEDGQWEKALTVMQVGSQIARKQRMERLLSEFDFRLGLFEQKQPYYFGD